MTILKVEPLAQGTSYKYVKAYFSSALATLSPSDIEIRGKKDQKLYSIQTAVLSSDGMAADLTLYGTADADRTTFLLPGTTYVMTLTQNGESTSLEFELPAYATDKIVTSVDTANNKITVNNSWKTGEAPVDANGNTIAWNDEEFKVAGKYDGNLGTLIGRTVNFQYDTDANLTAFNVDEAEVVYGAMQYVNDGSAPKDGYFKDKLTGAKYKNSATATSTKNITQVFNANDGSLAGMAATNAAGESLEPAEGDYQYAKLVLNPDGTVSTAFVLATLELPLFVTEVDGTKVIQDSKNGADLDGFIIVKDDEYVKPADLELGDVVFVNLGKKFADVYNNEVSGEIGNVISGKLDIDATTYDWNNAQYYAPADDVYKKLSTDADKNEASQNYLNSLDPDEDTTIWLNRFGKIAYIDGTETGIVITTDVTYLVVEPAESYTEALKPMVQIKTFNGSEKETLAIKVDDLKYYKGNAGKYTAANFNTTTGTLAFKADPVDATKDLGATAVGDLFPAGELMVVTYNAEGTAIGLKAHQSTALTINGTANAGTLDNTNELGKAGSPNLSKDTKVVTTKKNAATDQKWSTGSYTNLWIWNEKGDADPTTNDFSRVALSDFDNEIITTEHTTLESIAYRADGTKAVDLVVKIAGNAAYKAAETNAIRGMFTGYTKKNNSDNNKQIVNEITIIGLDGEKATYEGNGNLVPGDFDTATIKAGDYVELTQNKTTKLISAVAKKGDWQYKTSSLAEDPAVGMLAEGRTYDSEKLVLSDGKELTVAEGGAILLRYTEEGSIKHKVVTYSDVNTNKKAAKVWYDKTYLSSDGKKIQSAMIVVEFMDQVGVAEITLDAPAATDTTFAIGTIGSVDQKEFSDATAGYTVTYTLQKSTNQVTWTSAMGTSTLTNVSGDLTLGNTAVTLELGTYYRVMATTTDPAWGVAYSNVVAAPAAVYTLNGTNAGWTKSTAGAWTADTNLTKLSVKVKIDAGVVTVTDNTTAYTFTAADQYGNTLTTATASLDKALDGTTATPAALTSADQTLTTASTARVITVYDANGAAINTITFTNGASD